MFADMLQLYVHHEECTCTLTHILWLLVSKNVRYWVSSHAASAKARIVHQRLHHLRHLCITRAIIAAKE